LKAEVTKEKIIIENKDKSEIEQWDGYKKGVYDSIKREIAFDINKTSKEDSWRLVHDGINVLTLFKSSGYTHSINFIFEAKTRKECLTEIKRLKLNFIEVEE
jgi:hypothetical protein